MKLRLCTALAVIQASYAFAPARPVSSRSSVSQATTASSRAALHMVDPASFIQDVSSSFTLADDFGGLTDAVAASMAAASSNVADAATADAAMDVADTNSAGWFGFLEGPIKGFLVLLHGVIAGVGLPNAWGISIILLTILIKVLTFPLTKTQLESTNRMQAMQPQIKEIQTKYASNPEVMNQKMAEFYQTNNINPLAGCFPTLLQIPVFIGLYRGVLDLAKDNQLNESFLWLPNLEGPTYGADPTHGSDWILKGWTDGVPSLGWADTTSFLILPVLLVVSQFASMKLMQPDTDDPAIKAQQDNPVLKVLPLMIGWFSLNVPSALCLYWMTNNIVTTASSLFIRNTMKVEPVAASAAAVSTTATSPAQASMFAPPREKPAGFSSSPGGSDEIKPLTVMDAEVVADEEVGAPAVSETTSTSSKKNKRGKKKRKKRG